MTMKLGTFRAKAVQGSVQPGTTANGHKEIMLTMRMEIEGGTQDGITRLVFSPDAAPYSWERLRALGFKGNEINEEPKGIYDTDVNVTVKQEEYQGKTQYKVDIMAGGAAAVKHSRPISWAEFGAAVKAISGVQGSIGGAGAGGSAKPPF
jgi:hypothetical protein